MNRAIDAYYTITASTEFQEVERLRNKADHDRAQALYHAEQIGEQRGEQRGIQIGEQRGEQRGIQIGEQRGIQIGEQRGEQRGASRKSVEIAKSLLEMGLPLAQIAKATGLTLADIKELGPQS